MRYICFLLTVLLVNMFSSCEKSGSKGEYVSTNVDLYVQNSNGEDLLDNLTI